MIQDADKMLLHVKIMIANAKKNIKNVIILKESTDSIKKLGTKLNTIQPMAFKISKLTTIE